MLEDFADGDGFGLFHGGLGFAEQAPEGESEQRAGDAEELERIMVWQPKGDGIAIAIRDRLSRAAAGR